MASKQHGRDSPSLPKLKSAEGRRSRSDKRERPDATSVNTKLSSLMMRQGGPVYIPQDMRTHTHELRNLKDWVQRFLGRNKSAGRSGNDLQDIIMDLERYATFYFDLVRQSTVHSVELGRVQALLWNDFVGLFQRLFTVHEHTQTQVDLAAEKARVASQNEALKDRSELRQVRLELEEKLKLQEDTIRRKDRTIQLHVMHQTHLEQENLHLRELLNAEQFDQTSKTRDKGLGKMVGRLDGLIEDVEAEKRKQHNMVMDMKRLVDQVRMATDLGAPIECIDADTCIDNASWFAENGLEGFLQLSEADRERLERERLAALGLGPDGKPLAGGGDGHGDGHGDSHGDGEDGEDEDGDSKHKKNKGKNGKKKEKEVKSWEEIWATLKPKKDAPCYTRKSTEKLISQIYFDKVTADEIDDRDHKARASLPQFTYECILNKYGLKTLAKKNMLTVIASVHRWKHESARVKTFAQFCHVPGEAPRGLDVLNFYLHAVKYTHGNPKHHADETGLGLNALGAESHEKALIDLKDAEQSAQWLHAECFQSSKDVLSSLSTEFRTMVIEKDGLRRLPFDEWAEAMCREWEVELENTKRTLESMFISADVDSDGILTYDEFSALVWSIKPESSGREMTRLYQDALASSTSDSLTPEGFVKVASDHGLLSHMMQSKEFATLQRGDDFGYLESVFEEERERIQADLDKLRESNCDEELHEQLSTRLGRFEELLEQRENLAASWLCYRTLESGIRRAILRYVDGQEEDEDDGFGEEEE